MAFQKIGISLIANGAAKFARDLGFVNASLIRYRTAVLRYSDSIVKGYQNQYKAAVRANTQLTSLANREVDQITRLKLASQRATVARKTADLQLTLATQRESAIRARIDALEKAKLIANAENLITIEARLELEQTKLKNAMEKVSIAAGKKKIAFANLRLVNNQLKATQEQHVSTLGKLANSVITIKEKYEALTKATKEANTPIGGLNKFLEVLTGGFGKSTTGALGLAGGLGKAIPQAAALSLGLDLLKIGIDSVVGSIRVVMGVLNMLWGIFKKTVSILANVIKFFGNLALTVSKKVVGALWTLIKLPFNIAWKGLTSIWESLKRIGEIAIGMNLSNLMWNLGRRLLDLGTQAFTAATHFQLLTVRLRGLLQRDVAERFGVAFSRSLSNTVIETMSLEQWIRKITKGFGTDYVNGLLKASKQTDKFTEIVREVETRWLNADPTTNIFLPNKTRDQFISNLEEMFGTPFKTRITGAIDSVREFTDWISILSVKSIFSATAIADVFTLSMAYGFAKDEAKELTEAVVRFATGMGLENQAMVSIIENFGQMKAAGKITGTELRDLARGAFLPVNRVIAIMAENLGLDADKTAALKEELQDMTTEGKISINEFFKAFIQMTNKDFPTAIENAAITWQVFRSNVDDWIDTIIGWRTITPTLDFIAQKMTTFIGTLMTPEIFAKTEILGDSLKALIDTIWNSVSKVIGGDTDMSTFVSNSITRVTKFVNMINAVLEGNIFKGREIAKSLNIPDKTFSTIESFVAYIKKHQGVITDLFTNPNGQTLKAFIDTFIKPALNKLLEFVVNNVLVPLWNKIVEYLPKIKSFIITELGKVGTWIRDEFIPNYLDKIIAWFTNMISPDSPIYSSVTSLMDVLRSLFDLMGSFGQYAADMQDWETGGGILSPEELRSQKRYGADKPQAPSTRPFFASWAKFAEDAKTAIGNLITEGLDKLAVKVGQLFGIKTTGFKNLLGIENLDLDKDIATPFRNIAESIQIIMDNGLLDLVKGLASLAVSIGALKEGIGDANKNPVIIFLKTLSGILQAMALVKDVLNPLSTFFSGLGTMFQYAGVFFTGVKETLPLIPQMIKDIVNAKGLEEATKIVQGVNDAFVKNLMDNITMEEINKKSNGVVNLFENLYTLLFEKSPIPDITEGLNNAFTKSMNDLYDILKIGLARLKTLFDTTALYMTGASVMNGLWDGMKAIWARIVVWWETNVADKLKRITTASWQIESPSKVFEGYGKNLMLGLYEGIKAYMPLPEKLLTLSAANSSIPYSGGSKSTNNYIYNTNNYNLGGVKTAGTARDVVSSFDTMRILGK